MFKKKKFNGGENQNSLINDSDHGGLSLWGVYRHTFSLLNEMTVFVICFTGLLQGVGCCVCACESHGYGSGNVVTSLETAMSQTPL